MPGGLLRKIEISLRRNVNTMIREMPYSTFNPDPENFASKLANLFIKNDEGLFRHKTTGKSVE